MSNFNNLCKRGKSICICRCSKYSVVRAVGDLGIFNHPNYMPLIILVPCLFSLSLFSLFLVNTTSVLTCGVFLCVSVERFSFRSLYLPLFLFFLSLCVYFSVVFFISFSFF